MLPLNRPESLYFTRDCGFVVIHHVSGNFTYKMVHNHPSGDPTPSKGDVEMTKEVREAGEKLGIAVHDHLIIGRRGHASFKSLGLL